MIDRIKDVGHLNLKTGRVDMTHGAGGLASMQLIEAVSSVLSWSSPLVLTLRPLWLCPFPSLSVSSSF